MKNNLIYIMIKIPYLDIGLSKKWKNCIDIKIETENGSLNYNIVTTVDLFITLKSYACNIKYIPKNFYIKIYNSTLEGADLVIKNEKNRMIENMTFEDFIDWWQNRIIEDNKYISEESIYCVGFSYQN